MRHECALFCLVLSIAAVGCSSQSFGVGSVATSDGGDSSDAGLASIDPIALNNSWTYAVTVAGTYPSCTTGTSTSAVTQHGTTGGRDAYLVTSFCPGVGSFWFSAVGDLVSEYIDASWVTALATPVQEGSTWTNGTESFIWHSAGTVNINNQTFTDCYEVDDATTGGGAAYYAVTFCRGVGPVKWHLRDASGSNGYDAVLTQKTIN